jgi:apolipoprotein N-acyltransferase
MRRTISIAAVLGALALAVTPAFAGRSSSSVTLVPLAGAAAATTSSSSGLAFGSQVTFNVSTDATSFPWVEVLCRQGKTLVYAQTQGFFSSFYSAPVYQLGPTASWSSGAASCTATLFSYENARRHDLASTAFNVG